jgi:hypothetical protein
MSNKLVLFILLLLSINLVSALSCNTNQIVRNIQSGTTLISETITCSNSNNFSINVFKSGSFFTTNPSSISIPSNLSQEITINFDSLGVGFYSGYLYSSDGLTIPINVNITETIIDTGGIIVFPTAKVVNIQQGNEKQQTIQVIVPSNYPRIITIQSVTQNPDLDILSFGDLDLGQIHPGQTLNLPLTISAKNVQTGTYSTQINILATDSKGQIQLPSVNLQVVVSVGINPITNGTFTKPSCSLSNTVFSMNGTYTLTCTNAVENIEISPEYNEYIEGIKADYSAGIYTYTFKSVKQGNSRFKAKFLYKNSPIFSSFESDFKVTPSGSSGVGGVYLRTEYYQKGIKKEIDNLMSEDTVILVIDNLTGNLVSPFNMYVNGMNHSQSFIYLDSNSVYNLRITSDGYNDLIINNLSVKQSQLSITLNPDKGEYSSGDILNISSNVENVSILVNNYVVSNPYTISSNGNLTIEIKKENFRSANRTIFVRQGIYITSCSPLKAEWEKGNNVICSLSEKTKWEVLFGNQVIASGENDKLEFKINDYGQFYINSNGKQIDSVNIVKVSHWYNPFSWNFDYIKSNWMGFGLLLIIIVGGGFLFLRNGHSESSITPYS